MTPDAAVVASRIFPARQLPRGAPARWCRRAGAPGGGGSARLRVFQAIPLSRQGSPSRRIGSWGFPELVAPFCSRRLVISIESGGRRGEWAAAVEAARLETLVRLHQAELYRYLRYLGAQPATAEDLVQETFLRALRRPAPGEADPRATAAWLRAVARNAFYDHCRSRRRAPTALSAEQLEKAEKLWADEFLRQGDGFDYLEALRQCLETISDHHRRVLDLRYRRERSRAEMAGKLGMTEYGVKSLLRRIRAALADCVRRRLRLEEAQWPSTRNATV